MSASWLRLGSRPKPFRSKDFVRRNKYRDDYLRLAGLLHDALDFESVLDVGCGNGFLLEGLAMADKRIMGIDIAPEVLEVIPDELVERVAIGDFAAARGACDLACCVEVAEHIAPDRSPELVGTLALLATRWIYFTAAPPGQPGHGHINCREHGEWLAFFAAEGWHPDEHRTQALRRGLASLREAPWLALNSFILAPEKPQ